MAIKGIRARARWLQQDSLGEGKGREGRERAIYLSRVQGYPVAHISHTSYTSVNLAPSSSAYSRYNLQLLVYTYLRERWQSVITYHYIFLIKLFFSLFIILLKFLHDFQNFKNGSTDCDVNYYIYLVISLWKRLIKIPVYVHRSHIYNVRNIKKRL